MVIKSFITEILPVLLVISLAKVHLFLSTVLVLLGIIISILKLIRFYKERNITKKNNTHEEN